MTDPATIPSSLYTIGHSNRSFDGFVELLHAHGVKAIADVRRFPGSKRLPQFNDINLTITLPQAGIRYLPFTELGGRRRGLRDSLNEGWRNESFRAYADYIQTEAFLAGLNRLIVKAREDVTAVMCAEAVPWRCHRSLIADAMLIRGWEVLDILSPSSVKPHNLTPFAKVEGLKLTYPAELGV